MVTLENLLSDQFVQKLGWVLLHFIWQAMVIAILLAVLLRILRGFSANLRYVAACLAMVIIVLLPVVTMQFVNVLPLQEEQTVFEIPNTENKSEVVELQPSVISLPSSGIYEPVREESARTSNVIVWKQRITDILEPALPHIVTGWLLGVLVLSVWQLGGWAQLQKLRRKMVKQVDTPLKDKLNRLSEKLGVNQAVDLLESALVRVPTMIGWLRPVILLPAGALTGLSTAQLEAILAHELAHIKRYDYLVNILQTIVEILGFYHPALWWISHKIRTERENCCDDLAVTVTNDRISYARALTSMEEIRGRGELAVAAAGGNLISRVRRIIGKDSSEKTVSWIPAITAILFIIALAIPTTLALTTNEEHPASEFTTNISEIEPANTEEIGSGTKILIETQIIHVNDEFLKQVGLDADSLKKTDSWTQYRVDDSGNPTMFVIDSHRKEMLLRNVDESKDSSRISRIFMMTMSGREAIIKNYSGYDFKSRELGRFIKIKPGLSQDGQSTYLDCELLIRRFENFELFSDVYIGKKVGRDDVSESEIVEYQVNAENARLSDNHTLLILGGKQVSLRDVENRQPVLRHIPFSGEPFDTTSKIEGQANEIILIKTTTVPAGQSDDIDFKASSFNLVIVNELVRIYLDLDLEEGRYVEIKDIGKRKHLLKQVRTDSIGKSAKDFPAYASYIDLEIRSNFDLNLSTQRFTRGTVFEHDKWDAYFTGPDSIIGNDNFSLTTLCVCTWKPDLSKLSQMGTADKDAIANLVAVTIKPDNKQPEQSDAQWGDAVNGLVCAVKPVERSFSVGEDLEFEIVYKNVSDKPVAVCIYPDPFYVWTQLWIVDSAGAIVARGQHANGISRPIDISDFVTLQPAHEAAVRQMIKGSIGGRDILKAGNYEVMASINEINNMREHVIGFDEFCRENRLQVWRGEIKSGASTFIVLPENDSTMVRVGAATPELPSDKPVTRVYDISDLVSIGAVMSRDTVESMMGGQGGMGGGVSIPEQAFVDEARNIVNLIKKIDPNSWNQNNPNAKGAIYPIPVEKPRKLAVTQSPSVHKQIEGFLESRREQTNAAQISIELRYLCANEKFVEELRDSTDIEFKPDTFLNDEQVVTLLRASQKNKTINSRAIVFDNKAVRFKTVRHGLMSFLGYPEPDNNSRESSPEPIDTFCTITPRLEDNNDITIDYIQDIPGFEERMIDDRRGTLQSYTQTSKITNKRIPHNKSIAFLCDVRKVDRDNQTASPDGKKTLIVLIKPTIIKPEQAGEKESIEMPDMTGDVNDLAR